MNATQKLRERLLRALIKAQHATQEGIKHQFAELGGELIKLGREMEKIGGVKKIAGAKKVVRKIAKKVPATLHA